MSQISLQMYTLRDHIKTLETLKETLKKVAAIGYKNIQPSIPSFMAVEDFKSLLDENGLKADSVFAPCMTIPEKIEEITYHAQVLETDFIRTDSIPDQMADAAQGYERYAKILNDHGKLLKQVGLKLYYHFHAFEWINFSDGRRGIDILLGETDPELVGFQPDIFWLTCAGTEASDSIHLFKGRAIYMHVKDYAIIPRKGVIENVPRAFAPFGMGNLNIKRIIPAAQQAGIQRFVVEQDECDGDPFACIQTSYDNLHKMGIK